MGIYTHRCPLATLNEGGERVSHPSIITAMSPTTILNSLYFQSRNPKPGFQISLYL